MCPFLIEADEYPNRSTAHSVEEAVALLAKFLHLEMENRREMKPNP